MGQSPAGGLPLAQELQKHGAIKYSRGRITLLDRGALADCSCECYHAIKQASLAFKTDLALSDRSESTRQRTD